MSFSFHASYRPRLMALPRLLARGAGGEQGASGGRRGGRLEFRDYRAYVPGDDPRDLDWNLYLRLDRLVVKEYARDRNPEVWVLLDRSASMGREGGGKDRIAREVAGGAAYAALAAGAPVVVARITDAGPRVLARYRSPREVDALLALLEGLAPPSGHEGLEGLMRLPPAGARGRFTLLLSDLLVEPLPAAGMLAMARGPGGGAVLQVVGEEELHPRLPASCQVVDPEGGEPVPVPDPQALLGAYHTELEAHLEAVEHLATAHGLLHRIVRDGAPFEDPVRDVLLGSLVLWS